MRPAAALLLALATAGALVAGSAAQAATAATARRLVTVTGTVRLVAVDAGATLRAPDGRVLARFDRLAPGPGGQTLEARVEVGGRLLRVPGQPAGVRTGDPVAVTLSLPPGASGVTAAGVRVVRVGRQTAAGFATARAAGLVQGQVTGPGDHGLQVIPIFWSRHPEPTRAELARLDPLPRLLAMGHGAAAYWSGQSAGAIRIHTQVLPWRRVPVPRAGCDDQELLDLAMAAWGSRPPTDPYQHVMVYFPSLGACPFLGRGIIGGTVTWINGTPSPGVAAHELGHNFGLGHARSALCVSGGARVPLSPGCALTEYGDAADVMGSGSSNLNAALADYLGLIDVVPSDPGRTQRVTLAPMSAVGSLRAVRISVPAGYVYLEYRPVGDGPAGWAGVQAHYLPSTLVPYSELLDLPTDSTAAFSRVALPGMTVWRVPGAPVAVRLESAGPRGATVVLEPTGTDGSPPAVADPVAPQARQRYPSAVPVRWTPPATAARAVAQTVYLDSVPVRRVAATASAVTLSGVRRGRHRLQVVATDQAGNQGRSRVVEFDVDPALTDPPPLVLRPAPGETQNASVSVAWALVGPGRTVRLLVDGVPAAGGLRSGRHILLDIPDGDHLLTVQTMAGNRVAAASDPVPFLVDAVAPTAPSALAWRGSRLTWTRSTDQGSGVTQYRVLVDGGPVRLVPAATASVAVRLSNGRHTVTVTAEDRVGNVSAPAELSVLADASPPGRAVVTDPATGWVTSDPAVVLTVTLAQDPDSDVADQWVTVNGRRSAAVLADRGDGTALVEVPLGRGYSALRVTAVNGTGLRSESAPVVVRVL